MITGATVSDLLAYESSGRVQMYYQQTMVRVELMIRQFLSQRKPKADCGSALQSRRDFL